MNVEDRLRRAIESRTDSIEPSPDALRRINDKILNRRDPVDFSPTRIRFIVAAAAAVVLVGALLAGLLLPGGDDGSTRTGDTDTTERPTTTDRPERSTTTKTDDTQPSTTTATSAPASTTTTTSAPSSDLTLDDQSQIVWPRPSSDVRFDTAEAAARSFAIYYAGFLDPIVEPLDTQYNQITVRAGEGGSATTLVMLQLGAARSWFVGAAHSETIQPTPGPPWEGNSLSCPLHLTGNALAFEGTVQVRIDAYQPDGDRETLGSGFVTGSGSPPAGPFEGDLDCRIPSSDEDLEPFGVIRWWEPSAGDDGRTLAIVAFPAPLHS